MYSKKILKLPKLKIQVDKLKNKNKKIVLCHGCFDILHWGHALHFNSAKKFGDILIVSLTKDRFIKKGPNRPIFNFKERAFLISQLQIVDYVTVNNLASSEDVLKIIKPHFYVKGKEYKSKKQKINKNFFMEKSLVESIGGIIVYTNDKVSSSTKAVKKLYNEK